MIRFSLHSGETLTVLCLGAHSDDIEIGCGASILTLAQRHPNMEIHWVVLTSEGSRRQEAEASAARFTRNAARAQVHLHGLRDGFLPYSGGEVKEVFESLKGIVSPDLIFTHWQGDAHQDHRLLSELTWNTWRDHCILEYEIPKYDGDMGTPNFFVPLDESACETKIEYLMQFFGSQRNRRWFEPATFRALMRLRGMECNSASGYAEAFYCRKMAL